MREGIGTMAKTDIAMCLGVLLLAGCGTPLKEPESAGFLSDYSRLEKIDENHLFFSAGRTGEYSKFILDPVQVLFVQPEDEKEFTDAELDDLKAHFDNAVRTALAENDGYDIVTAPGPGVGRIRTAITQIEETIGVLNVTIYTKLTGVGIGGAAAEGELLDSVTGEQIAAAVRWGGGSRVLRAGFTKTGDAKLAIDRWANDLRRQIDVAHGRE